MERDGSARIFSRGSRKRACAQSFLAVIAAAAVAKAGAAFVNFGPVVAGFAAAVMASSSPAVAEQSGVLQQPKLLSRLEQQLGRTKIATAELDKLEQAELQAVRSAELAQLSKVEQQERLTKERVSQEERRKKAALEQEEKSLKIQIEKDLKVEEAKIEKQKREDIAAAKKVEAAEKQAARDTEKAERSKAGRDEAKRLATADKLEAAFIAATEKSETAIDDAIQRAESSLAAAFELADKARAKAAERIEILEKTVADEAEAAFMDASKQAEAAEKTAVEEEEKEELQVVRAVEKIEKEELQDESEVLEQVKAVASTVGSVLLPVAVPGVLLLVYALLSSLVAPAPEPARGGESDSVRVRMGRPLRSKTVKVTDDPWDKAMQEEEEESRTRLPVGAGIAGVAVAAAAASSISSSPSFACMSGFEQARPSRPLIPGAVSSACHKATQAWGVQGSTPSSVTAGPTWKASILVVGVVAMAARKGRLAMQPRGAARKVRVSMLAAKSMEVTEANPLHVVVAGGGVGGLMLAKALSKVPTIKVTMLEQTNKFARFGGPIQLASNALSLIRDVDADLFETLLSKFTFTGCRKNGLVDALRTEWYCPFDAMKGAADFFSLPYTGVVDRPDLQEMLLAALPEGVLQNGKKVAGYEVHPDFGGVTVKVADGTEVEADVLVGADGIWSAIRAQMWGEERKGPKSGCTYSGYIVFAGETVYQPEDYFEVGYKVFMGPKRYFVTSDVGRGRIQWYAFVSAAEGEQIPDDPNEKKDYLKGAFQGWSQQVLDLIDATPSSTVEDRSLYDRPPSVLRSWADGPVCLAGDACHPMMPNLGQGGCQAMEDGHAICERLKTVRRRDEVPGLLQDYYRSRVFRAAVIQGLSRIASDLLLSTFTFPYKASEGFSAPYGKGRGDFNYEAVAVSLLKYLLPGIFTVQFGYLYSFHPYRWTPDEVEEIVRKVMDRHRVDAHQVWDRRMEMVTKGEHLKSEEESKGSFFKLAAES